MKTDRKYNVHIIIIFHESPDLNVGALRRAVSFKCPKNVCTFTLVRALLRKVCVLLQIVRTLLNLMARHMATIDYFNSSIRIP